MNTYQMIATVLEIGELQVTQTKSGKDFKKRTLKVDITPIDRETGNPSIYKNTPIFEFTGDRTEQLDTISVGQAVQVSFTVRGVNYTAKDGTERVFNTINGESVQPYGLGQYEPQTPVQAAQPQSKKYDTSDLPF